MENIIKGVVEEKVPERSISVLQRKFRVALGVYYEDNQFKTNNDTFSVSSGGVHARPDRL